MSSAFHLTYKVQPTNSSNGYYIRVKSQTVLDYKILWMLIPYIFQQFLNFSTNTNWISNILIYYSILLCTMTNAELVKLETLMSLFQIRVCRALLFILHFWNTKKTGSNTKIWNRRAIKLLDRIKGYLHTLIIVIVGHLLYSFSPPI